MTSVKVNHKFIYDAVKGDIVKGAYPAGALLPTELTLARQYSVSRPTIAKVYNQLQSEGYVTKKKGTGTVVNYNAAPSTRTFGLLLPGSGESEIFSVINDRILRRSESDGFDCLWEGATASDANIRAELIEGCCEDYIRKRVDGIFFSPLERIPEADRINRNICDRIAAAGIPLVLIDRDIVRFPQRSRFDLVCLDNFNAGCLMASHLIAQGCERIYFFSRPDSAYSVDLRLAGVRHTVQESGLAFDTSHVFCGNPEDPGFVRRMPIVPYKTGIVCANDSTAAALMYTLTDEGVGVSTDVVIAAFDNMKYSMHLKRALTSLRQPCEEIADISIELMLRRVRTPEAIAVTVNLTGEIIVRESSRFI